ncbi:hypothetical protein BJ508DRAFT_88805 [Ascobolus immersus RN42]|uniref:Uncharacterized protein n=1 Tax=Ascobolus immersus RN42 TaxID=1160509 RepID=A0A3N4I8Q1_ASCIM|nr:hypothetical protein BJ508DRAFT_88805 [Ascobolus immersus RN42]
MAVMIEHILLPLPDYCRPLAQEIFEKHGTTVFLNSSKTKPANTEVAALRLMKLANEYPDRAKQLKIIIKTWEKPHILRAAGGRALHLYKQRKRFAELRNFIEKEKEVPISYYTSSFPADLKPLAHDIVTEKFFVFLTNSKNNVADHTTITSRLKLAYPDRETKVSWIVGKWQSYVSPSWKGLAWMLMRT